MALESNQQINVISLGKIDVLCLARRESDVTRSIFLPLFPCTPSVSSNRRDYACLDAFCSSRIGKEALCLCIDIIYLYVQTVLTFIGSAFIQTMLWYIRAIIHLSYRVVFFCMSAQERRDICSEFMVTSHTSLWFSFVSITKFICASVFVAASIWTPCCICYAVLHKWGEE